MSWRVLHTADWHLGDRLAGLDRLPDQLARLEELVAHAEQSAVDVLLVCGDVLEEARPQRLAPIVSEVARLLGPSLERGMQCVFLRGNHDSPYTFELLSGVQRLIGGGGAVRFVGSPELVTLRSNGEPAGALVALPYPTADAYGVDPHVATLATKQAALGDAVREEIAKLSDRADADLPGLPKLMAGHFLLREAPATTGTREVSENEDVRVESDRLGDFAYVALGHVHQPTALSERVRYSGALDRVDFGEAGEPRGAVLVEISDSGAVTQTDLGLHPTPMERFEIRSLGELGEKTELLEDPERTIVKLVLRVGRGDSASVWLAEARARFARLHEIDVVTLDDPLPALVTGRPELADVGRTVRDYLTRELEGDPDRDELLALADAMLGENGTRRT